MLILRPRLQGSGQIFERTKTCTDPPFVYMGPEQLLKYSNSGTDVFKYDDAIHHNTSSSTSIAHALWGMLPYYHSLAFSYGRANTIRMATCGRTYIHIFILFCFVLKTEEKRLNFKKYPDTCWRGLSDVKLYTYLLHFALSSAILKMWVSQVVMGVCNAWIAAVSIETCASVVRTDGRTVTWQQATIKISRMHR